VEATAAGPSKGPGKRRNYKMKVYIPLFIREEGQTIRISRDKKENPWNYQEYKEDRICYPLYIHWVKEGKEKLTEISCHNSRRFGGNCECINHAPHHTYTKGENVDDNVFTDMLSKIEWEVEF
jgi:hypothetical protein